MKTVSTKKIVMNGLMIALVFLCTYFTRIPGPIPPGYLNFGDIVIMVAAILLGRNSGLFAGAIGSAFADIISPGGLIFAPVTFIVKGLEGYIVGMIADSKGNRKSSETAKIIAVIMGSMIMIAGYFVAELYILKAFDSTFGYTYALGELPLNLIQGGVSSIVGYILAALLMKANVQKYILE